MKNILGAVLLLLQVSLHAQHYYRDILGTRESNQLMKRYLANHVLEVNLVSYEADGALSENFLVTQVVNPNDRSLKTITRSGVTDESALTSWFDASMQLIKTIDTSGSSINTAVYEYDNNGRLSSIRSFSGDTLQSGAEAELHQWVYNEAGLPVKMIQVINGSDSTIFTFTTDDNGNIIQETPYKTGKAGDPVYYYYDNQNRMTDIVRYNYKLKKLIPDYMFEYSPQGQVIQKITIPSNFAADYLIWRYQYDDKGLKTKEVCFNKDKQLTGKIEYHYRFGQ
jgi:antitoxin component YwqK of YwqJK toxin-antitoxin module